MERVRLMHDRREAELRVRPDPPRTGRRTRIDLSEIRRGRYEYWIGRVRSATLAARWGVTRQVADRIVKFQSLAWV